MKRFHTDPSGTNADAARGAVGALRVALLEHLDHEERDFEPFAAAHHADPPMKQAQKAVQRSHKGDAGMFVAWLRDDADAGARAQLNRDIPAPVQFVFLHTSGRRYAKEIAPAWA